nr:oligosaccharide flippase family protein [Bifidobacterium saguinibicoloris]
MNIGVFALNIFATKLITFLLVPLYTFNMSTAEFGVTDMALTVVTLMVPLASFSVADAVLRFVIDDAESTNRYVTIGFAAMLLSCIIAACLLPLLHLDFFGGLGQYQLLFWLMYVVNAFLLYLGNVARALNHLKLLTADAIVTSLVTGGSAVVFISWMRLGADGYFYSMILGSFVGVLVFLVWGRYLGLLVKIDKEDWRLFRSMMMYAVPLIPNALFWWIGTSINRFFITGMLGIAASGLFAAASKLPNLLNVVYSIFQQAWTLSAFQEFKRNDVGQFFSMVFKLLQSGMAIGAAGLTVCTPWLAALMLQKDFYPSWGLIPILVLAFYFNSLNAYLGTVFTTTLKTKALFTTTIVGALVSIAFTWGLMYPLALYGPCVAMVISNAVVFFMRVFSSRRIMKIRINWLTFSISVGLLIIQTVDMAVKPESYMLFSCLLCILIVLVQLIDLLPVCRLFLAKYMHQPRHRHHD